MLCLKCLDDSPCNCGDQEEEAGWTLEGPLGEDLDWAEYSGVVIFPVAWGKPVRRVC